MEHVNESFVQAETHVKQTLDVSQETVRRLHNNVMREIQTSKKRASSKWVKVSVAALAVAGALTAAVPQVLNGLHGSGETVQMHNGAPSVANGPIRQDANQDSSFSDVMHSVSDGTVVREINAKNTGFDKAVEIVKKQAGFDLYLPHVQKLNMSTLQYIEHVSSPGKNLVDFNYYLIGKEQLIDLTVWFSEAKITSHPLPDPKLNPAVKTVQINGVTWYLETKKLENVPNGQPNTELEYNAKFGETTIYVRMPDTFKDPEKFLASFQRVN
jgi:hypothetical protein